MKKLQCIFLSIAILFALSLPAFAAEGNTPIEFLLPTVVEYDTPDPQPANLISIESCPRNDGTGIDVTVGNLGVDGLDSVSISVSATDHPIAQTQTAYVLPILGKTFGFDIPMTKCDMTYYIHVIVTDGGQTQQFTRTAGLEYSEERLALMDWGQGRGFSSRQDSLNYHFQKHHNDIGVNASNIVQYLGMAIDTFNDTLYNIDNYKVVLQAQQPGYEPAHKYTHKTNYRFIIYGDGTDTIYTFGGK